ncbi:MAG: hypothetical protein ACE5HI_17515, partial [bacterium]
IYTQDLFYMPCENVQSVLLCSSTSQAVIFKYMAQQIQKQVIRLEKCVSRIHKQRFGFLDQRA